MDDNPYSAPAVHTVANVEQRQSRRNPGCVTAMLILLMISSCYGVVINVLFWMGVIAWPAGLPAWASICGLLLSLLAMAGITGLFRRKMWGMWAVFFSLLFAGAANYWAGLGVSGLLTSIVLLLVLYGSLQLGKPTSAWSRLE